MNLSATSKVLVYCEPAETAPAIADLLTEQSLHPLVAIQAGYALNVLSTSAPSLVIACLAPKAATAMNLIAMVKESDPLLDVIVLAEGIQPEERIWMLRHCQAFDVLRPPPEDLGPLSIAIRLAITRRYRMLDRLQRRVVEPVERAAKLVMLTDRERETLRLVADGLGNRDIALKLVVSENTVRNNLARIFGKLGAENRTQAVNIARRLECL